MTRLNELRKRLAPLKVGLLGHPLYLEITNLSALHVFMEHHVFAVWDFMSLLKELQRRICCVQVPWIPVSDPVAARLVNEIVLAEESDVDRGTGFVSHFGLYHRAMNSCGANTHAVDRFLTEVQEGIPVPVALDNAGVADCIRRFVCQTFDSIENGSLCAVAAAFTFGREDLLPALFQRIVDRLGAESTNRLDDFCYYLRRHIGLDGDEHGPMAGKLIESLCGADESRWRASEEAALQALEARRQLWDGIYAALRNGDDGIVSRPKRREFASHRLFQHGR